MSEKSGTVFQEYPYAIPLRIFAIAMLVWALLPTNPYGFYTLLRWVLLGIFSYMALLAHNQRQSHWVLAFAVGAGLYNPLIPAAIGRHLWTIVNFISIAFILRSIFVLKACPKSHANETRESHE